ncbi:MobP3 family relaxase [Breznakia pachnodae]|uniref:Ribosomal protein S13 n=1 Tax=Breznakia pachnodae TaxID=265178 RepID=A0ABU0E7Q5_9FIRM|nr:MobP3 family relaxase [Breznakia pachnodae]MDQ0362525.1 ribosomal protein S13 [Breznakia pachnodae]
MSRLIVFSDYLKPSDKAQILFTVNYIATRDGVELNKDYDELTKTRVLNEKTIQYDPTEKQLKLIDQMTKEFKDLIQLDEYGLFENNPSMYTASLFIHEGVQMLEELAMGKERYLNYIAERPGVVANKTMSHGLFDQLGDADLEEYNRQLQEHTGNVWRDIISLTRLDAEELDYENQESWKTLLRNKMNEKAEGLGIPEEDFKWCAAFHDEGYHPHVHVMCWDEKARSGFQTSEDIEKFKSSLANDIFSNEMWLAKELKYETRKDLENEYKKEIEDMMKESCKVGSEELKDHLEDSIVKLSSYLNDFGSRSYEYQTAEVKQKVNYLVSSILSTDQLRPLLSEYVKSQENIASFYQKDTAEYANKFLNQIINPGKSDRKVFHNTIIRAAYDIKDNNYMKKLLLDSHLETLNKKLETGYSIKGDVDPERLVKAVIKVQLLQDKDVDEILDEVNRIRPDEEKNLETFLDVKDKSTIRKSDIIALNKSFNEKIDKDLDFNKFSSTCETNNAHAAAKVMQQFMSFLGSGSIQNDRELRRLQSLRREDEFVMKRTHMQERARGGN